MAHHVHPKIFRIRDVNDWNSRWLAKKNFSDYLEEDFKIREYIKRKFNQLGIGRIEIERFPGRLNIILNTARPGLIIGRAGTGVEELKKNLEKIISAKEKKVDLKIEIKEIKNPWLCADLVAQWIAQQIEKRTPYRRVLKQALEKVISTSKAEGARVEVAGRLDGIEIARTEWLQKGKMPRQTIRADIDYAKSTAYCTYGTVGVKVWIYKGEKS